MDNEEIKLFWERLNSLIKQSSTTQQEVSVKCNLNPRRLQNLSAGNRLPDCNEAYKIAKLLNTTVEYLVTGIPASMLPEGYNRLSDENKRVINAMISTLNTPTYTIPDATDLKVAKSSQDEYKR